MRILGNSVGGMEDASVSVLKLLTQLEATSVPLLRSYGTQGCSRDAPEILQRYSRGAPRDASWDASLDAPERCSKGCSREMLQGVLQRDASWDASWDAARDEKRIL